MHHFINSKKHWYISNLYYNKINLCAVVAQVFISGLRSQSLKPVLSTQRVPRTARATQKNMS